MTIHLKNIRLSAAVKIILVIVLFFSSPHVVYAQEADTTVVEETQSDDTTEEYKEGVTTADNFLHRSSYDSLVVGQHKLPDSLIKKMKEQDAFWYADAVFEKKKKEETPSKYDNYVPLGQRSWFQTLLWVVIIGGFATFLMIYLTGSNVGLFRRKNVITTTAEEETIPEDIFAINYQKEIDKAAAQGNYRLAVRLMYLRLLKNMAEKNIIQYKQDKTNFDYLLQLHSSAYYKDFFRITRNYEYSWYGQFDVSEEAYKIIRNDFEHFDRNTH